MPICYQSLFVVLYLLRPTASVLWYSVSTVWLQLAHDRTTTSSKSLATTRQKWLSTTSQIQLATTSSKYLATTSQTSLINQLLYHFFNKSHQVVKILHLQTFGFVDLILFWLSTTSQIQLATTSSKYLATTSQTSLINQLLYHFFNKSHQVVKILHLQTFGFVDLILF